MVSWGDALDLFERRQPLLCVGRSLLSAVGLRLLLALTPKGGHMRGVLCQLSHMHARCCARMCANVVSCFNFGDGQVCAGRGAALLASDLVHSLNPSQAEQLALFRADWADDECSRHRQWTHLNHCLPVIPGLQGSQWTCVPEGDSWRLTLIIPSGALWSLSCDSDHPAGRK